MLFLVSIHETNRKISDDIQYLNRMINNLIDIDRTLYTRNAEFALFS